MGADETHEASRDVMRIQEKIAFPDAGFGYPSIPNSEILMPIHEYLPYLAVAWTAYFIAVVSPGPATLALAATSMTSGRAAGVSLALGVYTGSFIWACLTSAGLAAILTAYAGILTVLKIVGGIPRSLDTGMPPP